MANSTQIKNLLQKFILSLNDLNKLLKQVNKFLNQIKYFFNTLNKIFSQKILKTIWHIINNPDKALKIFRPDELALIIAGVLYFFLPIDAIPDVLPIIGFTDDISVLTWIINTLKDKMEKYYNQYAHEIDMIEF